MMSHGSKIKLRRPKAVIEKNLQPLKENNKKELAQRLYYQKHFSHQSPLVTEARRQPVHQRLGVKQYLFKRLPLGTNTSSVLPKRKPRLQNGQTENTPLNFRAQKFQRTYSAQTRIEMIRSQQNNKPAIKLRRLNAAPKNLTIELKNTNFAAAYNFDGVKRFKMRLDANIQSEISEIQSENSTNEIFVLPTLRIIPATTGMAITERFGSL